MRRRVLSAQALAAAALLSAVLAGCTDETAALLVDVPSEASASPQYFHGNCFAGWSVAVELRARETSRVEVFVDSLSYRMIDQGASAEIGGDVLDTATIESRYGANASVIGRGSTRVFAVSAATSDRPQGPIAILGNLSGRDEYGHAVGTAVNSVTSLILHDDAPPSGGACSP